MILAGIVLLGLALRGRGGRQKAVMLAGWGIAVLVLGLALLLGSGGGAPVVAAHPKSAAQIQAEDDTQVAALNAGPNPPSSPAAASPSLVAGSPIETSDVADYASHDEPEQTHFTVVGGLPHGWVLSATNNDVEGYFSTERLLSLGEDGARVACNWYSSQGDGQLAHTSFETVFGPADNLWSSFKPALSHPSADAGQVRQ